MTVTHQTNQINEEQSISRDDATLQSIDVKEIESMASFNKSSAASTPVFIKDEFLGWRPADLLGNKSVDDSSSIRAQLTQNDAIGYTLDYYRRSLLPMQKDQKLSPHKSFKLVSTASQLKKLCTEEELIFVDPSNYENNVFPLQDVDSRGKTMIRDNLSDIPFLHEASILFNLSERNERGIPYTRAGSVLVALNPLKWINNLYSEEKRTFYAKNLVWSSNHINLESMTPHIYEISSLAYDGMMKGENQSIIVSGETGAGKTESVKILMSHLATFDESRYIYTKQQEEEKLEVIEEKDEEIVQEIEKPIDFRWKSIFRYRPRFFRRKTKLEKEVNDDSQTHLIGAESDVSDNDACQSQITSLPQPETIAQLNLTVQRVLDADILFEAFGNAKTQKNNNSSRFSKYTLLQFDVDNSKKKNYTCNLAGSVTRTYLLQKSRAVLHNVNGGERSFHIFYQLLAAPEDTKSNIWKGLLGATPSSYKYLCDLSNLSANVTEGDELSDSQRWSETFAALQIFNIVKSKFLDLMRSLCGMLHLGNLIFNIDPENDDGSIISSQEELRTCSEILGIPSGNLESVFTKKIYVTPNETYSVPLTHFAAKERCDSFAQEIYSSVFAWLVGAVNNTTGADTNYNKIGTMQTIGLLDIFGFESFDKNHFEQMCINHANEKLQNKFIEDVFFSVQTEYKSEGIDLRDIKYEDNSDVLTLIEGSLGLIEMLNEECFMPKGSDAEFVSKLYSHTNKEGSPLYKEKGFAKSEFGIKHYAGYVKYDANSFIKKNINDLPSELVQCAIQSSNRILQSEFKKMKIKRNSVMTDTVWKKFDKQMIELMKSIKQTRTSYIRCIVPNKEKKPGMTDVKSTLIQLRYAGVMAAVKISRSTFPNRMEPGTVLSRFSLFDKNIMNVDKSLEDNDLKQMKVHIENLLRPRVKHLMESDEYGNAIEAFICGKTKVFFRTGVLEHLEDERRQVLDSAAILIQCYQRKIIAKAHLKHLIMNAKISNELKQKKKKKKKRSGIRKLLYQLTLFTFRTHNKRRGGSLHRKSRYRKRNKQIIKR